MTGGSGKTQRPPQTEEHSYFIFGAPPSKKQAAERERQVKAGKLAGDFKAKEIRSVGLLKFMRNIYAHRAQQVEAGRFPSEQDLCMWLLEPFPFLLMGVYEADERHRLSTMFEERREDAAAETLPPAPAQQQSPPQSPQPPAPQLLPQVGDVESTSNPLAPEAQGAITAL